MDRVKCFNKDCPQWVEGTGVTWTRPNPDNNCSDKWNVLNCETVIVENKGCEEIEGNKMEVKEVGKNELVKYIRKGEKLLGCLIGIKEEDGKVRVGFSKYNNKKEDKPFSKHEAKTIARSRAKSSVLYTIRKWQDSYYKEDVFCPVPNFPSSMKSEVSEFIERCLKYFKVEKIENSYVIKDHNVKMTFDNFKIVKTLSLDNIWVSDEVIEDIMTSTAELAKVK